MRRGIHYMYMYIYIYVYRDERSDSQRTGRRNAYRNDEKFFLFFPRARHAQYLSSETRVVITSYLFVR